MNIVWFKRDLRIFDHAPLIEAMSSDKVCALYIVENSFWALPDIAYRHWEFTRECLQELDEQLRAINLELTVRIGEALPIFQKLHSDHSIDGLFSHQESGNLWQRERTAEIENWCKRVGIPWHPSRQFGVKKYLKSRDGWSKDWNSFMDQPILHPAPNQKFSKPLGSEQIPFKLPIMNDTFPCPKRQIGGRSKGIQLLESFLNNRSLDYKTKLSSPLTAYDSCSRLSPYISHGSLSIREVVQATRARMKILKTENTAINKSWLASLRSFYSRLHWHCHFIQKLEDNPLFEVNNVHSGYNGMRSEVGVKIQLFKPWSTGHTGFPFVDACMRALIDTGWINFRMRAMLQSFASYHLWIHWRFSGLHLARLLTDYEPGIHWNQAQMQSGTTGINTVRIYNPVKQSMDQDPTGRFIRRWVPELASVDDAFIHQPWQMKIKQQETNNCIIGTNYPGPIVDHVEVARNARAIVYGRRKKANFFAERQIIQEKYGSRKSGIAQNKRRQSKPKDIENQMSFDL